MDVFHWNLRLDDRDTRMLEALPRIAQRSHDKYGISIRKMSFWRLGKDLKEFQKIYNAAWSKNWGFSPYDDHDLADLAINYRLIFDKRWFMLAENDKEVVAAAITIPDINQVLKKMKGRLLPLGWWHYLNRKRIIDRCRVGFLGVLPEYQHTGVAAQLYIENFDMAAELPDQVGRARLDPRDQPQHEPRPRGDGRPRSPSACASTSACSRRAPSRPLLPPSVQRYAQPSG